MIKVIYLSTNLFEIGDYVMLQTLAPQTFAIF